MREHSTRNDILTIPNAMSVLRLALIPLYMWLYCEKNRYGWALAVLIVSGVTDMLDGYIARRFDQVTDVGKILDPVADKLTQAALIVSLAGRYPQIWFLFALFAVKELLVGSIGLAAVLRTDIVRGARWFGKVSTAVLEVCMGILIIFFNIPDAVAGALIIISGVMLTFAGVNYIVLDVRALREHARLQAQAESVAVKEEKKND